MHDQNQRIFAKIFRTSSPWNLETFNRTSGLQNSLALGLQSLQVFGCWRRSSELQSSESSALDQNHFFRGWDCSSELPVSESLEWLLGKSSELADAGCLLIRNTSSDARLNGV